MCKLCDEDPDGDMQACQNCGRLICWDVKSGDDVIRPAYVTASADLYCDECGAAHDRAEEEAMDEDCGEIDYDPYWGTEL